MKEVRHLHRPFSISRAEQLRIAAAPEEDRARIRYTAEQRVIYRTLLTRGVPYTLASELPPPHGIIGDYFNDVLSVTETANLALSEPTIIDTLRERLRKAPTYTDYLHHRFSRYIKPHGSKLQRARQAMILSAITDFPSVQPLVDIVTTFHEMAEGDLSEEVLKRIGKLSNKAYFLVFGKDRADRAGIPEEDYLEN